MNLTYSVAERYKNLLDRAEDYFRKQLRRLQLEDQVRGDPNSPGVGQGINAWLRELEETRRQEIQLKALAGEEREINA